MIANLYVSAIGHVLFVFLKSALPQKKLSGPLLGYSPPVVANGGTGFIIVHWEINNPGIFLENIDGRIFAGREFGH